METFIMIFAFVTLGFIYLIFFLSIFWLYKLGRKLGAKIRSILDSRFDNVDPDEISDGDQIS